MVDQDSRTKDVISVQNCGLEDEKVFADFVKDKKYLSTTILKFKKINKILLENKIFINLFTYQVLENKISIRLYSINLKIRTHLS